MILYALFNVIFDNGDWPDDWALGIINPLRKKESLNVPDNYIQEDNILGKLLESILKPRLKYKNIVLEMDNGFQFGFKADCRTSDNLDILYSLIKRQKYKLKLVH